MTKEEKEKLIELSDLNREDNVKYISSEAQGIAITLDSDRYAPTLCKLERAYICGRRKSENRITELEKKNAELKEVHELFADIIEAFTSRSYNDDFEMAQAGKEIYELFYGGKDPKEVFHNADVPKSSRQLLEEAKKIISNLYAICKDNHYPNTSVLMEQTEQFLKEIKENE